MTNTDELEHTILSAKILKKDLAKALNISEACLYSKLNNRREFKASEICKIRDVLGLSVSETIYIFLQ